MPLSPGRLRLRLRLLFPPPPLSRHSPVRQIDPTALVDPSCEIGPYVTIGPHAQIAAGCHISAPEASAIASTIGAGSLVHPGVTIYPDVNIGRSAILHSGCVIGADGFGFVLPAIITRNFPRWAAFKSVTTSKSERMPASIAPPSGHRHRERHQTRQHGPYRPQLPDR